MDVATGRMKNIPKLYTVYNLKRLQRINIFLQTLLYKCGLSRSRALAEAYRLAFLSFIIRADSLRLLEVMTTLSVA